MEIINIISKLERDGQPSNRPHILNIRILPPWYYTIWAKAIYILLLLSLIAWTINFFRVKNRLKAERREKEKYWNSPVRKWHSSPTYPMSEDTSQPDHSSYQPVTSVYGRSTRKTDTGRSAAQRHENQLADSSGTQLQPD